LHTKRLASLACAGLIAVAASGLSAASASAAGTLNGAGSSLVAPVEAEWAAAFATKTGNTVTYQSVGSGTGITDIQQRLVDFGASDAPLTSTQAQACNGCVQIPWALSATGVGINIQVGGKPLGSIRLTGPVIANIYLGHITNWDDPAIKALNKGVALPNLKITPVFRSDGSGDSYAFSDYLSRVSSTFKSTVGVGTQPTFSTGVGAKGNSGMISVLSTTNGAIAYVAVGYLLQNWPRVASVKNAAGKYEVPNLRNIENAAKSVHSAQPAGYHIVNPPKAEKIAYPISTFTYVIAPAANAPQAGLLKEWITFVLNQGQAFGPRLDFAPMPKLVLNAAKAAVKQIQ
jgi:phosphate transport system substrate-binding protein